MGIFSRKPPEGAPYVPQINEQAVAALDQALGALGPVQHIFSPGGQPIRSVGVVTTPGYTLLVTYGFSELLAPEPMREGIRHEYSIAIPQGEPVTPWADAFLRAQCHSMLAQRVDVKVGECIPFNGIPLTCIAFQPEHHAMMPPTTLVGMFVAADPVIPRVATPAGTLEIRRLVGADPYELDRALTWDPPAFLAQLQKVDPLLLSSLQRPSYLTQAAFREAVEARAKSEGSTVESLVLDMRWEQLPAALRIHLPQGPGMVRALDALRGRIGFKRKLVGFAQGGAPITFEPGTPGMTITPQVAELAGDLTSPPIATIVAALEAGAAYVDLEIQAPTPARARSLFFAKVAGIVKTHELDQAKVNKELGKLMDEARTVAALGRELADIERDADR
ncbi:MAG: suppressor of fused domain protein, partial [Kofleriaceae bacterium]